MQNQKPSNNLYKPAYKSSLYEFESEPEPDEVDQFTIPNNQNSPFPRNSNEILKESIIANEIKLAKRKSRFSISKHRSRDAVFTSTHKRYTDLLCLNQENKIPLANDNYQSQLELLSQLMNLMQYNSRETTAAIFEQAALKKQGKLSTYIIKPNEDGKQSLQASKSADVIIPLNKSTKTKTQDVMKSYVSDIKEQKNANTNEYVIHNPRNASRNKPVYSKSKSKLNEKHNDIFNGCSYDEVNDHINHTTYQRCGDYQCTYANEGKYTSPLLNNQNKGNGKTYSKTPIYNTRCITYDTDNIELNKTLNSLSKVKQNYISGGKIDLHLPNDTYNKIKYHHIDKVKLIQRFVRKMLYRNFSKKSKYIKMQNSFKTVMHKDNSYINNNSTSNNSNTNNKTNKKLSIFVTLLKRLLKNIICSKFMKKQILNKIKAKANSKNNNETFPLSSQNIRNMIIHTHHNNNNNNNNHQMKLKHIQNQKENEPILTEYKYPSIQHTSIKKSLNDEFKEVSSNMIKQLRNTNNQPSNNLSKNVYEEAKLQQDMNDSNKNYANYICNTNPNGSTNWDDIIIKQKQIQPKLHKNKKSNANSLSSFGDCNDMKQHLHQHSSKNDNNTSLKNNNNNNNETPNKLSHSLKQFPSKDTNGNRQSTTASQKPKRKNENSISISSAIKTTAIFNKTKCPPKQTFSITSQHMFNIIDDKCSKNKERKLKIVNNYNRSITPIASRKRDYSAPKVNSVTKENNLLFKPSDMSKLIKKEANKKIDVAYGDAFVITPSDSIKNNNDKSMESNDNDNNNNGNTRMCLTSRRDTRSRSYIRQQNRYKRRKQVDSNENESEENTINSNSNTNSMQIVSENNIEIVTHNEKHKEFDLNQLEVNSNNELLFAINAKSMQHNKELTISKNEPITMSSYNKMFDINGINIEQCINYSSDNNIQHIKDTYQQISETIFEIIHNKLITMQESSTQTENNFNNPNIYEINDKEQFTLNSQPKQFHNNILTPEQCEAFSHEHIYNLYKQLNIINNIPFSLISNIKSFPLNTLEISNNTSFTNKLTFPKAFPSKLLTIEQYNLFNINNTTLEETKLNKNTLQLSTTTIDSLFSILAEHNNKQTFCFSNNKLNPSVNNCLSIISPKKDTFSFISPKKHEPYVVSNENILYLPTTPLQNKLQSNKNSSDSITSPISPHRKRLSFIKECFDFELSSLNHSKELDDKNEKITTTHVSSFEILNDWKQLLKIKEKGFKEGKIEDVMYVFDNKDLLYKWNEVMQINSMVSCLDCLVDNYIVCKDNNEVENVSECIKNCPRVPIILNNNNIAKEPKVESTYNDNNNNNQSDLDSKVSIEQIGFEPNKMIIDNKFVLNILNNKKNISDIHIDINKENNYICENDIVINYNNNINNINTSKTEKDYEMKISPLRNISRSEVEIIHNKSPDKKHNTTNTLSDKDKQKDKLIDNNSFQIINTNEPIANNKHITNESIKQQNKTTSISNHIKRNYSINNNEIPNQRKLLLTRPSKKLKRSHSHETPSHIRSNYNNILTYKPNTNYNNNHFKSHSHYQFKYKTLTPLTSFNYRSNCNLSTETFKIEITPQHNDIKQVSNINFPSILINSIKKHINKFVIDMLMLYTHQQGMNMCNTENFEIVSASQCNGDNDCNLRNTKLINIINKTSNIKPLLKYFNKWNKHSNILNYIHKLYQQRDSSLNYEHQTSFSYTPSFPKRNLVDITNPQSPDLEEPFYTFRSSNKQTPNSNKALTSYKSPSLHNNNPKHLNKPKTKQLHSLYYNLFKLTFYFIKWAKTITHATPLINNINNVKRLHKLFEHLNLLNMNTLLKKMFSKWKTRKIPLKQLHLSKQSSKRVSISIDESLQASSSHNKHNNLSLRASKSIDNIIPSVKKTIRVKKVSKNKKVMSKTVGTLVHPTEDKWDLDISRQSYLTVGNKYKGMKIIRRYVDVMAEHKHDRYSNKIIDDKIIAMNVNVSPTQRNVIVKLNKIFKKSCLAVAFGKWKYLKLKMRIKTMLKVHSGKVPMLRLFFVMFCLFSKGMYVNVPCGLDRVLIAKVKVMFVWYRKLLMEDLVNSY